MRSRARHNTGSILVFALWAMALLGMLAGAMAMQARMNVRHQSWSKDIFSTQTLNAASYRVAIERYAQDKSEGVDSYLDAWMQPLTVDSLTLPGFEGAIESQRAFRLYVHTSDEQAKLNINLAPESLILRVLVNAGASEEAPQIAAAIVDWRDPDNGGTGEAGAYEGTDPPYAPPNADFVRIDELLHVHNVTPALYLGEDANRNGILDPAEDDGPVTWPPDNEDGRLQVGLLDLFTVIGDGSINVNTVSVTVLEAVFAELTGDDPRASAAATNIVQTRQGRDRVNATPDDAPFENVDAVVALLTNELGEEAQGQALLLSSILTVESTGARFYFRSEFPETGYSASSDALIVREDGELRALEWHDWQ